MCPPSSTLLDDSAASLELLQIQLDDSKQAAALVSMLTLLPYPPLLRLFRALVIAIGLMGHVSHTVEITPFVSLVVFARVLHRN